MRYIVLLRGINVGGHRKVPMVSLRELLTSLGHGEVVTYIQSGNAIITSSRTDEPALTSEIEQGIEREFGFPVTVMLRTPEELSAVIAANPYPDSTSPIATKYVAFLSMQPEADELPPDDVEHCTPDECVVGDRVVYLRYPDGAGRAKLTSDLLERRLGVRATVRNWNTVNKLFEMAVEQ